MSGRDGVQQDADGQTGPDDGDPSAVTRRMVLRGATVSGVAVPLLAACGGGASGGSGSGSGGSGGSGSGKATVPAADVPVGGGTILRGPQVVVTQPSKGDFKAFTAVCTHQGCALGAIQGGNIVCPCHGSEFSIKDGSNTRGPNGSAAGSVAALAARPVSVQGDQISISS